MELSKDLLSGLKEAFAAESLAVQRYTYFAQVAEIEGHVNIAGLLGELAESIGCAAHGHFDWLMEVADPVTDQPLGKTSLNVSAAITAELQQANAFYPDLVDTAHAEGFADVASWLETLCALKKAHVARLQQVLEALQSEQPPSLVASSDSDSIEVNRQWVTRSSTASPGT